MRDLFISIANGYPAKHTDAQYHGPMRCASFPQNNLVRDSPANSPRNCRSPKPAARNRKINGPATPHTDSHHVNADDIFPEMAAVGELTSLLQIADLLRAESLGMA